MDGLQVQWLLEPEKIDMAALFRMMMEMFKTDGIGHKLSTLTICQE